MQDSADQFEVGASPWQKARHLMARASFDPSQHFGGLPLEPGAATPPELREKRLEVAPQGLGDRRRGLVLVDDAARRCLEGRGERAGRVGYICIDQSSESERRESCNEPLHEEKDVQLWLAQPAHRTEQNAQVVLLPALHDRGRVTFGGLQIHAIGRAGNFNEALGPAAHSADGVTAGWAGATRLAAAADRTRGHGIRLAHLGSLTGADKNSHDGFLTRFNKGSHGGWPTGFGGSSYAASLAARRTPVEASLEPPSNRATEPAFELPLNPVNERSLNHRRTIVRTLYSSR